MKDKILNCVYNLLFNKYSIEIQGWCPRQAWWMVDGNYYYFRARGTQWSLEISKTEMGDNFWSYCEKDYAEWPECGGLSDWECLKLINKALKIYAQNPENQRIITICRKKKK